ncbi:hypothetical protein TcasGA2_TC010497 [Tribolium castaneum]|uniref:Uncharacterized protein n=1 Tax=Tribolium castaneum TaxID=7070 RepID=D6WE30_TRICA|nr:hypothetical protein TcasGA2_TC010497 [Tribolium castaneum]
MALKQQPNALNAFASCSIVRIVPHIVNNRSAAFSFYPSTQWILFRAFTSVATALQQLHELLIPLNAFAKEIDRRHKDDGRQWTRTVLIKGEDFGQHIIKARNPSNIIHGGNIVESIEIQNVQVVLNRCGRDSRVAKFMFL